MSSMWGPALQAEVDYRRERLVRDGAVAVPGTPQRQRRLRVRGGRAAELRAAGRGWALPGSGAWPVAR